MNIFILDSDPQLAARMLCNKHVPKMVLETAQLLCSAHTINTPYRKTHTNHPCAKWTRASSSNYQWLVTYGLELGIEYTRRFNKKHKSSLIVEWCDVNRPNLPELEITEFAQAMPDCYKITNDAISAYRAYYIGEKSKFAKWIPLTEEPSWWPSF
jgi:hypothetical protein